MFRQPTKPGQRRTRRASRPLLVEHLERRIVFANTLGYYSVASGGDVTNDDGSTLSISSRDVVALRFDSNGDHFHELVLDGEDIGLDTVQANVDAVHRLPTGDFLLSTMREPVQLFSQYLAPGVGSGPILAAGRQDLLLFQPTSLGEQTTGTWSILLDGSAVGLAGTSENIDAVAVLDDGRIVVSTTGDFSASGVSAKDEDLVVFDPVAQTWAYFFDGSDVQLGAASEDVDAISFRTGAVLELSTKGPLGTQGIVGSRDDVAALDVQSLGANTSGSFQNPLLVDGSTVGISGLNLDAWSALILPTIGAIGDSVSDEYATESYDYAMNWVELLEQQERGDFGEFGTWGSPRRTGYSFNWARVGADTDVAISAGQHTGLAGQAASSDVEHAVIAIGANDFSLASTAYGGIYNGSWTSTQVNDHVDDVVENLHTIVSTVDASGAKILLATVGDPGLTPKGRELFPDAAGRQEVADVIERVNSRLRTIASDFQLPLLEFYDYSQSVGGSHDAVAPSVSVGNVTITNAGGIPATNSYVNDEVHPHTVSQALVANLVAEGLNLAFDAGVIPFSEQEMLELAGLTYGGADTFPLVMADFVTLPIANDTVGPNASESSDSTVEVLALDQLRVSAEISDADSGGRAIVAAEFFVDALGAPGTGVAMTADDGAFDGAVERVAGEISPSDYGTLVGSAGSHTLFIRGMDADGNWGPAWSSSFHVGNRYFLSMGSNGSVTGTDANQISFTKHDVIQLDVDGQGSFIYSMYFDGSDVGLSGSNEDVDAVHVEPDGTLFLSTRREGSVSSSYATPGSGSGTLINFARQDVLQFSPTSLGTTTTGDWSLLLDGSNHGLNSNAENIDAISIQADGALLISTIGSFDVPGVTGRDEDIVRFDPSTGDWELHWDGSDVDLKNASEDVDGAALTADGVAGYLSTLNVFQAGALMGGASDIFRLNATQTGPNTQGQYASDLSLDAVMAGLSTHAVDALSVQTTLIPSAQQRAASQTIESFATPDPTDVNFDARTDVSDLRLVWNAILFPSDSQEAGESWDADVNRDGAVTIADLRRVFSELGSPSRGAEGEAMFGTRREPSPPGDRAWSGPDPFSDLREDADEAPEWWSLG